MPARIGRARVKPIALTQSGLEKMVHVEYIR